MSKRGVHSFIPFNEKRASDFEKVENSPKKRNLIAILLILIPEYGQSNMSQLLASLIIYDNNTFKLVNTLAFFGRSVFHSVLQQEFEDLDEDEDGYFD